MASFASIKIRPKTEAKPSQATIAHNQRLSKNIDLLPIENRLPNYHLNKLSNVTKIFKDWSSENEKRYQKINGRKLRSDASRLESLAIILSGEQVSKCDPNEIWEKAQKFKTFFEERYKTKIRTMDWHRDEGHIDDNGVVQRNDHIHIEYDNVNEDGKVVRRLFSKGDLIKFQDQIADIYGPLGFSRSMDTTKKSPNQEAIRGKSQKKWKADKKNEESKKQKATQKATQKALKAEMAMLRAKLINQKAKAEEYQKLDALNRKLKAQIKAKKLMLWELEEEVNMLNIRITAEEISSAVMEQTINDKDAEILCLEKKVKKWEEEDVISVHTINSLADEVKELKENQKKGEENDGIRDKTNSRDPRHERGANSLSGIQQLSADQNFDRIAETHAQRQLNKAYAGEVGAFAHAIGSLIDRVKALFVKDKDISQEQVEIISPTM